ncbi:SMI1/KNR4 family protein [Streptomyces yangpuensis]|uniref:SMI1/KNR4 family protein n=1 Tax=Streptomyces yangpuensis TaxID=1648182 RepID=UPI00380D8B3E
MTEHPDNAALAQVMAPTFGVDEALDWPSVEERLDRRLPSDYKAFMSLYGGGGIDDDLLGVLLPLHEDGIQWDPGAIEDEIPGARSTLHWREQQIRWKAGRDPFTNEPDPYADMFPR